MAAGIYEILNTATQERYIGASTNVGQRKHTHWFRLARGVHGNPRLQAAWTKYGEGAFRFSHILTCAKSRLTFYEQQLLDDMKPAYNINPTAGVAFSGLKHTPETRARMAAVVHPSRACSTETRTKISAALRRSHSRRGK